MAARSPHRRTRLDALGARTRDARSDERPCARARAHTLPSQVNPTRGNHDAMNVHPVEFIVGEYLHLAAMMVVPVHAATCLVFIVMLGVLTSLNHTRYDVKVPYGIFQVRTRALCSPRMRREADGRLSAHPAHALD